MAPVLSLSSLKALGGSAAGRPLDARKAPINQWLTRPENRWRAFSALPAGDQLKIVSERQAAPLISSPDISLLPRTLMGSWAISEASLENVPGFTSKKIFNEAVRHRLIDKNGDLLARAIFPDSITCTPLETSLTPDGFNGLIAAIKRSQLWSPDADLAGSVMAAQSLKTTFATQRTRTFSENQISRLIAAAENKMGGDIFSSQITDSATNATTIDMAIRARSTAPLEDDAGKDIEWLRKIDVAHMFDIPLVHLAIGLLKHDANSIAKHRDFVAVNSLLQNRFSQIFPVVADWS